MFGHPLGDLDHVEVAGADLALLLADVDGRLGNGWGAALLDAQVLHLSSQPGGTAHPRTITSVEGFVRALVEIELDRTPRTVAFHLDLDLDQPLDEDVDVSGPADGGVLVTLSPSLADLAIVAVVGPGVSRDDHTALAEFAARGGIGVFNTWGAKGVFRWDSPFHYGTIGLQERDVELAGLADVDLVITSGLDPSEFGPDRLAGFVTQDVPAWQIGALLADWPRAQRTVDPRPPLYDVISRIVTPLYEQSSGPVTPPRAALHLSGAAPEGAVVAADAGVAGFWIARAFPTGIAGSVVVPALDQPGFAAAAALVSGLSGRPCIGVVDGPPDESTLVVMEAAATLNVPISLQSWVAGDTSPEEHLAACERGFAGGGAHLDVVGVDDGCLEPLLYAVGPITAWA
ncbi:MAG: hypothetical protein U0Q22_13480 [Acidimicrobiales bacterium]